MATIDVIEFEDWIETQQYEFMALKKTKAL
jgi:hypothetical protein